MEINIVRKDTALEGALCVGQSRLFDSTFPADHLEARALCLACPAFAQCREELVAAYEAPYVRPGYGPTGTWAGEFLVGKRSRALVAECGTDSGYFRHRRLGTEMCEPCKEAHCGIERARYRRAKAGEGAA